MSADDECVVCGHAFGSHVAADGACDAIGCDCKRATTWGEYETVHKGVCTRCQHRECVCKPRERMLRESEVDNALRSALCELGLSAEPAAKHVAKLLGLDPDRFDALATTIDLNE